MKQQAVFLISLTLVVFAVSWFSKPAADSDIREAGDRSNAVAPETNQAVGMRAYIDPETRKFVPPPVFVEPDQSSYNVQDQMNYSSEGLVEKPSEVEGGGIMVDLQGRFRNTSVATINPDGTVSAPCLPVRPEKVTHLGEATGVAKDGDER